MKPLYLNPFTVVQKENSDSIIALSYNPSRLIRIFDHNHPLFGIEKSEKIFDYFRLLSVDDQNILLAYDFVSFTPYDRQKILDETYQECNSTDMFSFTLFPTLNCNFNCVYCYQKHINQPRMSQCDYEAIIKLVHKKIDDGAKKLSINLMGGEPTLEIDILIPFLDQCRIICTKSNVKFNVMLTTNGFILDAPKFVSAGINSYQVTLDGPAITHNKMRPTIEGNNTFHIILKNLFSLKEIKNPDIDCTIRINHTEESIRPDTLSSFLTLLSDKLKSDNRFKIHHTFASDLGGGIPTSFLIPKLERKNLLENINDLTIELNLFTKSEDNLYKPNGGVCYAARQNHISILPGLKLVKCTVALDEEFNNVGELTLNGKIKSNKNLSLWINEVRLSQKCNACEVAPICQNRSCPYERIKTGINPCHDVKYDKNFYFRMAKRDGK